MMKYHIVIVCCIFLLLAFQSYSSDKLVHIFFCDVGQGDAALIQLGHFQILVDTGRNEKIRECLEGNMPIFDKSIEYLFITHSDSDHIGGLNAVFSAYSVTNVVLSEDLKKRPDFSTNEFDYSRHKGKDTTVYASEIQSISISNILDVEIISPDRVYRETKRYINDKTETLLSDVSKQKSSKISTKYSKNNLSTVLNIKIGNVGILLLGDAEDTLEQALLERGLIDDIDVLKVAHHGSKTSTTQHMINKSRPEIAVVSSGENNQYGHPSPQVIERLLRSNAKILRTDQLGTIHVVTDGTYVRTKH